EQLPFGAFVSDSGHNELGYVAKGSQIFIKSDTMPDSLHIDISKGKVKKTCVIAQPNEHAVNICR
uniref:FimD/PapC C-terminal domain-containing protein n=1 Tax=Pantoea ananas TaxID=553 RepID=UPI001B308F95